MQVEWLLVSIELPIVVTGVSKQTMVDLEGLVASDSEGRAFNHRRFTLGFAFRAQEKVVQAFILVRVSLEWTFIFGNLGVGLEERASDVILGAESAGYTRYFRGFGVRAEILVIQRFVALDVGVLLVEADVDGCAFQL